MYGHGRPLESIVKKAFKSALEGAVVIAMITVITLTLITLAWLGVWMVTWAGALLPWPWGR